MTTGFQGEGLPPFLVPLNFPPFCLELASEIQNLRLGFGWAQQAVARSCPSPMLFSAGHGQERPCPVQDRDCQGVQGWVSLSALACPQMESVQGASIFVLTPPLHTVSPSPH